MNLRAFRFVCVLIGSLFVADGLVAQTAPSPEQAQAMLQARPELAAQLRQRILTSGLTPEQVRARLKAEGYPENLLDAYLPGTTGAGEPVGDNVLTAIRRLGIADDDDVAVLRTMLGPAGLPAPAPVRDDRAGRDQAEATELFGLSLFRSSTSEFLPMLDGPVDPSYRLGPGDQLVLILTGEVELAHTLDVTREGFIVIPQVGQLGVANLTMTQLENLLYDRLGRSYSGVRRGANPPTRFSVSVSRLRAIQIFVTGEVVRPGSYRISSAGTAMTALYAAGGPTEVGTLRSVTVRRGQAVASEFDVYNYLLRGDNSKDLRLENGDIVFVKPHGPRVRMVGEVLRPATYELKVGESLRDALVIAGGFKPTAQTSRVQVERIVPASERVPGGRDRTVIDVTNAGASIDGVPALAIEPGDVIRVFAVTEKIRNSVVVEGNVWSPGRQSLAPGMMLSDVLRAAGGLRPDTYLGRAHILRLRPDNTRELIRATLRDTTGAVVNDISVAEDDDVRVFSLTEFRPERFVAIGGSVQNGGRFPWLEGMTLRDLVMLAGGLREGAYLREAEIARLPADRSRGVTAVTVRVPLDSSYLADYVRGVPYAGSPGLASLAPGAAAEVALEPHDNVLILQQPDWQLQRTIALTGEVRFPGRYALLTKDERLTDVIARAGGLTAEADAGAAVFTRDRSAAAFIAEGVAGDTRIRVGIDLPRALRRPKSDENTILIDNDEIFVPTARTTVEIRGAVNSANAVSVERGRGLGFYVRSAGGPTHSGDIRRAYVIQPSGKIETRRHFLWVLPLDPTPRAGATVVIPERTPRESQGERIATVAIIAQTIASLAAVVAIMR